VGEVCTLSEDFDWFSRLPLIGVRALVTRPKKESLLSQKLRALGAAVTDFPCIHTEPLPVSDEVFNDLPAYEWIVFTSPVGAEIFFTALKNRGMDIRCLHGLKFAAVGPKTAEVVTTKGIHVDYIPETYNGSDLGKGLPLGKKALLFRAEDGDPRLASTLKERGFGLDDIAAYKTIRENSCAADVKEAIENREYDVVTFTSASTVQGFIGSIPDIDCSLIRAACIGEETAAEARKHGFATFVSEKATIESMIELIRKEFA
jgi:uroporphyrinogen III methyltransferase/synthase